jgi:tyrosine-protein kinase Etk/Wzc
MSFTYVLAVLKRRTRLLLSLALVGAALGGVLARLEEPTYEAKAVLRVANERRALIGEEGEGNVPASVGRTADPLNTMIQLVRSRSVVGAVVDSLGSRLVSRTPEFSTEFLQDISVDPRTPSDSIQVDFFQDRVRAKFGPRQVQAPYGEPLRLGLVTFTVASPPSVSSAVLGIMQREIAIDALLGGLAVTPRMGTDVVDVSYVSVDPTRAQQVVNYTVNEFRVMNSESATEKSRKRREFLAEQLAQTDSLLGAAQAELSSFRSRRQLASSRDRMSAEQAALLNLESRRAEMEADKETYAKLLQQLKAAGSGSQKDDLLQTIATSPAIGSNPTVDNLFTQLSTYQYRLDSLTTGPWRASESNPDVIQLRSLIGSTTNKLVSAVSGHVASLDARIGSLANLQRRGASSIEALPAMAEEEERLGRRVETLASMADGFRKEYQMARMAEAIEAGDVEIVDYAGRPYMPLLSSRGVKVGLGFVLGLMIGFGLAFMLESINTSIRRPEDLESMLLVPGLAVIPRLSPTPASDSRRRLGRGKTSPEQSRAAALGTLSQPFSVGTEAFRMLRTSLLWSDPGAHMKSLVVTSAGPGEGKTLTAANLAVSFAHDGMRVLLVDCDVRRPRLHNLFRVPRGPGLMELLTPSNGHGPGGLQSLTYEGHEDEIAPVLRNTPVRGLSLLTCGALPTNASSLLSGPRMRALMERLGREFDLIVLDTPPVLATADAGIMASLADGVLLVVRAGHTDRAAAQRANQQLSHVGAKIVGTVLNDPGGEVKHFGEYYYPYDYSVDEKA